MRQQLLTGRAAHLAAIAVPFIVVVVAWSGLRHDFPVFQSGDERIHYDIVLQVAHGWPRPILWGYQAWSGPLVYWLLATLGLPFANTLMATRLAVCALSWATCAVAYLLFRDRLRARPSDALALALILALSPFFFGQSFLVLTDNPTLLFVVAALDRLVAWVRGPRSGRLVAFSVLAGAAALMRQFSAWLFVPAAVAVLWSTAPWRRRAGRLAVVVVGALPLAALTAAWGGALPKSNGPSGLGHPHPLTGLLLTLAVVGVYGALMLPVDEVAALRSRLGRRGAAVTLAAVAAALAALGGGALRGSIGRDPYELGWISFAGHWYPGPQGTSLLLWVLVPLGAAVLAALLWTRTRAALGRVFVVALVTLVAVTAVAPAWYQRYVDFPVLLLLCCLALTSGARLHNGDRLRWLLAVVLSAAWMVAWAKVS